MLAFLLYAAVLLLPLFLAIILESGVLLGAMYGYHRFCEPIEYGDFSFDHLSQESFMPVFLRVTGLVGVAFLVLHYIFFILAYFSYNFHFYTWLLNGLPLTLLVFVALFGGLRMLFQLSAKPAVAIAAVSTVFYPLVFHLIIWRYLP